MGHKKVYKLSVCTSSILNTMHISSSILILLFQIQMRYKWGHIAYNFHVNYFQVILVGSITTCTFNIIVIIDIRELNSKTNNWSVHWQNIKNKHFMQRYLSLLYHWNVGMLLLLTSNSFVCLPWIVCFILFSWFHLIQKYACYVQLKMKCNPFIYLILN